jgi:RNA polymerase sigma-70 factor (ECF subfamily)
MLSMARESDQALVEALSTPRAHAAGRELFVRHWDDTWRTAYGISGRRELAEDAAQEAFLRLFRRPGSFDTTRPLRPWLRKVVANLAIDELRRTRSITVQFGGGEDEEVGEPWLPDVYEPTVAALRRLPQGQRLVLLLRYWGDLSVDEIAELLAVPRGTVMSRVARALEQLRKELEPSHA